MDVHIPYLKSIGSINLDLCQANSFEVQNVFSQILKVIYITSD